MNERLETMALSQYGVFGVADAARVGVDVRELGRLERRREIVRVRRGAYILSSVYATAARHEQYPLRVMAVLRSRPEGDRASHQSALALFGLARFGVSEHIVEIESAGAVRRRRRQGVSVNPFSGGGGWSRGKFVCVSPAKACVQVAATAGFTAAVCAMDSALHQRLVTKADLEQAAATLRPIHRDIALRAVAAADEKCESPGETRSRIIFVDAGFTVVSQQDIFDGTLLVGRVDLLLDGCVVVEFDGLVKYEGLDGKANLAAEKLREQRLNRLGYEVVRIVWSDLSNPGELIRRVREARALARERRAAMSRVGA